MAEPDNTKLVSEDVLELVKKLIEDLHFKHCNMDITEGTIRGDNYMGIIAKVHVKGEKNGKQTELHLVVKSAPNGEAFRALTPIRLAYSQEIYTYNTIFPEFVKIQQERRIQKPFNAFAKFYTSSMKDFQEALILEDMNALGYKLCNRQVSLDYNHVLLVVKTFGKLHALSYALRDQKPELFQDLSEKTEDKLFTNIGDIVQKDMKDKCRAALDALDPVADKVAYEKFKEYQETKVDQVSKLVKSNIAGKYAVIGHGDSWINNILFKYQDDSKPTHVCLLDWQLSRLGSPALDLSYFFFTSTDKNFRRQHYHDLIKEYYETMTSFLRELGSDPDELIPFEVLQEHLKKFSIFGLHMAVMVLFIMTSENDEIPDVHNITDFNDPSLNYQSKNVDKYHGRIRGVVQDFVEYNYDF